MARGLLYALLFVFLFPGAAGAVRVSVDGHEIIDGVIYADVSLTELPSQFLQELRDGMEKRLEYQVELFRVWDLWMDEFVGGTELIRTIKFDLLKAEYSINMRDHGTNRHETLGDEAAALSLICRAEKVPVLPISEAQRGTYFIRVQVRSRVRELPPVVGGLLFFIPEVEFFIEGKGSRFPLHK